MTVKVDPSHKVVDATDEEQAERTKVTVSEVVDDAGQTRFAPDVHVVNPTTEVAVTAIGGASPEYDTSETTDGTELSTPVVKVRRGRAGLDGGLVDQDNPFDVADADTRTLLAMILGELQEINLRLQALSD